MVDLNIGKWLKEELTRDQGVNAIISGRIYPVTISLANKFPALSYRRLTTDLPGTVLGFTGNVRVRVRINAWDTDYDVAVNLISKVVEAFKDGGKIKSPNSCGLRLGSLLPLDAGDEYYQRLQDVSKDFLFGPFVDYLLPYAKVG